MTLYEYSPEPLSIQQASTSARGRRGLNEDGRNGEEAESVVVSRQEAADLRATIQTPSKHHQPHNDALNKKEREVSFQRYSLELEDRAKPLEPVRRNLTAGGRWQTHFRDSPEEERLETSTIHSLLPTLSFLPPLIHRYTGTTTMSLLVGVICCVTNIALYITSGVVSRVLQQQEHVAVSQTRQEDSNTLCLSELGEEAHVGCAVPAAPAVTVQRLRVPYTMVWLPQVCQLIFLFIAFSSIRRKYGPRLSRRSADDQRESEAGGERRPSRVHSESDVEAERAAKDPCRMETASEEGINQFKAERAASVEKEEECNNRQSLMGAENDEERKDGTHFKADCVPGCLRACWSALLNHYMSRIYVPYLEEYDVGMQAYLKEEVKYGSLGKLILACFFIMCLYLLQGWFWSIAVGTKGMSICSVTAIYSTNSLFVFLFTSLIYKEGVDDFIQLIALILATVGVALIAYQSQGEPQSTTGVFLSVCSSAAYGLFEVLYKMYLLQNRSNHPLTFVFFVSGIMGTLALLFMWVPIPLLHTLGLETFPNSFPPLLALLLLAVSCVCSTIYNILLQISLMLLPSPMLVAMCFLLSLPPAAASDALAGGGGGVGTAGCAFIASALLITGIKEWNIKEREGLEQVPDAADLCTPFVFKEEPRLSTDSTSFG